MKKTVNINLGGSLFVIDEDAYKVLRAYLNDISQRLSPEDSEVVNDVESRMAEIFNNTINQSVRVVDINMADRAIATIGSADEFGERPGGRGASSAKASERYAPDNFSKKFYRNTSNAILGGVCSGVADYLDIDVTLVRILAVIMILLAGLSVWFYIILWIITPRQPVVRSCSKGNNAGESE